MSPTKKPSAPILIALFATLAGILMWYVGTYTWVGSVQCRRDAQSLDLSGSPLDSAEAFEPFFGLDSLNLQGTGLTAEQIQQIQSWHPDCKILWDVPFQGGTVPSDSRTLSLNTLSEEDIGLLELLPELTALDLSACTDYGPMALLQERRPDLLPSYQILVGGEPRSLDTASLTLTDAKAGELLERLAYLPQMQEVSLLGQLPSPSVLAELVETYPHIRFRWDVPPMGHIKVTQDVTSLELTGADIPDTEALEQLMDYCPNLQTLTLRDTGLSNETLLDIQNRHPRVKLIWELRLKDRVFSSDVTRLDLKNVKLSDVSEIESLFPYLSDLEWIDLSFCGLENEVLDGLNRRHENIQVIWTVTLGRYIYVRTDATYFMLHDQGSFVLYLDRLVDLKYCPSIDVIDLGHTQVRDLSFVQGLPNLRYLIVADADVDSLEPLRGHPSLMYLEVFMTYVTDYSPLLDCPNLIDLNICYTTGDIEVLRGMTWLERLWLKPPDATHVEEQYIMGPFSQALPNTHVQFSTDSTGRGWRKHPRYYEMRDILGMPYL